MARLHTLADLVQDDGNANQGTTRGRDLIEKSLRAYGAGRSVVADRHNQLIAGNQTVAIARHLGLPIRVVRTDGTELVVVQRIDLDLKKDPRARGLGIADNRAAEAGLDWNLEVLQQVQAAGLDLTAWWTPEEWAQLTHEHPAPATAEDRVLAPGPTRIRRGDLFALGRHRLLCGDATNATDVARLLNGVVPCLMACDPPYGVNYRPQWRATAYPRQRTAVGAVAHDDQALWPEAFRLFPGDVLYVWHAARMTAAVAATIEEAGFALRAQIIWAKQHFALSRGDYHWQHEPCWYAVRRGAASHWQGDRTQTTLWTAPNLNTMGGAQTAENPRTAHSTQKPVRLFEIPLLNHTRGGEAVYDPFVGSGTTVIAAEKTGRTAYVMDILPEYVQVVIDRWEAFTGQRATRVAQATAARRPR